MFIKKNMSKTKGFTLIELLVVIAIIGILSGLIIVSMSGATNSAKDARIKSAMDQFRSTAEIYKLNAGGYGSTTVTGITTTTCTAAAGSLIADTSDGLALCNDIQSVTAGAGALTINSSATGYCIEKVLPGGLTWCLDYKGNVGCTAGTDCTTDIGTGCDATAWDCI